MKNYLLLFVILFSFSCSRDSDKDDQLINDKYYLYKMVEITNGIQKVHNFGKDDCQSKSNSYFVSETKFYMQMYEPVNCSNSSGIYDYDQVKNKIQILPYLYYSIEKTPISITLQTHFETNDDPNYTTIYYFKK